MDNNQMQHANEIPVSLIEAEKARSHKNFMMIVGFGFLMIAVILAPFYFIDSQNTKKAIVKISPTPASQIKATNSQAPTITFDKTKFGEFSSVSPDGKMIAYSIHNKSSDAKSTIDFFIFDLQKNINIVELKNVNFFVLNFKWRNTWSPNSKYVIATSGGAGGTYQINIINVDIKKATNYPYYVPVYLWTKNNSLLIEKVSNSGSDIAELYLPNLNEKTLEKGIPDETLSSNTISTVYGLYPPVSCYDVNSNSFTYAKSTIRYEETSVNGQFKENRSSIYWRMNLDTLEKIQIEKPNEKN